MFALLRHFTTTSLKSTASHDGGLHAIASFTSCCFRKVAKGKLLTTAWAVKYAVVQFRVFVVERISIGAAHTSGTASHI
jgi:hypothetical protein